MSSQAREKSALTNDIQICVLTLATAVTSVAMLLGLLCYFGCSCINVQLFEHAMCAVIISYAAGMQLF